MEQLLMISTAPRCNEGRRRYMMNDDCNNNNDNHTTNNRSGGGVAEGAAMIVDVARTTSFVVAAAHSNININIYDSKSNSNDSNGLVEGRTSSRFSRVCVFCGAYSGSRHVFHDAAIALGKQLVRRDIGLVYGGGSAGLMGMISKVVSDGGLEVLGVMPRTLMKAEITGKTVGKVVVVGSMHERKAEMARLSDAFIALPGGYGTLEELLEVITWSQLGIHDKPVGLLNVDGYYDSLLAFLDNAVGEGFIQPSARHIFVAADNAADLMTRLEEYVAAHDQVAPKHCWDMHQESSTKSAAV